MLSGLKRAYREIDLSGKGLQQVWVLWVVVILILPNTQSIFAADAMFDGKSLTGWNQTGTAIWRAEGMGVVGKVDQASDGWLVSQHSYQDIGLNLSVRCDDPCKAGILLGAERSGDRTTGTFISLSEAEIGVYEATLDSRGHILELRKPKSQESESKKQVTYPGPAGHPFSAAPAPASFELGKWNHLEIHLFTVRASGGSAMTSLRVLLNDTVIDTPLEHKVPAGGGLPPHDRIGAQAQVGAFGPIALHVEGRPGAEVHFKDLTLADYTQTTPTIEHVSDEFRQQRLTGFYYGDGMAVGDFNRDGHLDLVTGPLYWEGPDFKVAREIDVAQPLDPTDYPRSMGALVADFNADGWPDVIETGWPAGDPLYLYINPKNEQRRWERYKVLPAVQGEIYALADIDGDGLPEFVYTANGYISYAKPDPAKPTDPWIVHNISQQGPWGAHALGVGDINGDGRLDVLDAWGWWEHPESETKEPWRYHAEVFGRRSSHPSPGGAQMFVYDVNGDGLPDVITSLEAHGYGLAWFEQKRNKEGKISFQEHIIMDRDPSLSHGVAFSELHGVALADVDGDGLLDIVTGKNKYSWGTHWTFTYPDEDGEGLLYWFKLVRKSDGSVDFIPHEIDNYVGLGRPPIAIDLNGDGVVDIATDTRVGTYVFFGKKDQKGRRNARR
jgi:hypothetical protein